MEGSLAWPVQVTDVIRAERGARTREGMGANQARERVCHVGPHGAAPSPMLPSLVRDEKCTDGETLVCCATQSRSRV